MFFAIVILEAISLGCATKEVSSMDGFCKPYGANAAIYWMIEGKPIKDGVADSLGGFQCKYLAASMTDKVKSEDVCKTDQENKIVCTSKKYELKELCSTGELGNFWGKDYEKTTCK